ncbi:MAG: SHOCT-like domain-containing protein [Chloroflexia bacterium]
MFTRQIELDEGTAVEIEGEGDLSVLGVSERFLRLETGSEEDVEVQQEAGRVRLHLHDDARLLLWQEAPLTLRRLRGDFRGRGLQAPLEAEEVQGDLSLSDLGEVRLGRVEGDVSIHQAGDVRGRDVLSGDLNLQRAGAVELSEVEGDVALYGAASLSLERAGDDVSAGEVSGDVRLKEVHGDVLLRDIGGAAEIGRAEGDLTARHVRGDLLAGRVDGDIVLDTSFQEGHTYRLVSRGDIVVRCPEGTAARFLIQASSWVVPPSDVSRVERREEGRAAVQLGQGGPDVYLTADGEVVLGPAGDWERSVHDFSRRMEEWGRRFGRQMEEWGERLREQLQQADWERIGREVEEATARIAQLVETRLQELDLDELSRRAGETAAQAEERVRQVDWERIAQKIEQATRQGMERVQAGLQRLQERLRRSAGVEPPAPPPPPPPPPPAPETPPPPPPEAAPAPLDEERMAILRLVEEGRLTADEAAALLDALE